MPRVSKNKYDDVYVKVPSSGKIFMYVHPTWKTLYPVVEFIKNLELKTVIGYKYGKNQSTIRNYGSHYNHNLIGYSLSTESDYINTFIKILKKISFTFRILKRLNFHFLIFCFHSLNSI
jgi:hypothetical protein